MGSKNRIAKYIAPIIQEKIDTNNIKTYIEPFVGGANMIDKIRCENRIGSDYNKYLIALLNHVASGKELYSEVPRELYNDVRATYKNENCKYKDWEVGNIGFIASFNGRWFDGGYAKAGYTSAGIYRNYYDEAKRNILAQYESIKDVEFYCRNYTYYLNNNVSNAVIYCDPPYANTKQYANAKTFDYEKFWEDMKELSKNNIVLISELNAPNDFECIWQQSVKRTMKPDDKDKIAIEKLFTYKY